MYNTKFYLICQTQIGNNYSFYSLRFILSNDWKCGTSVFEQAFSKRKVLKANQNSPVDSVRYDLQVAERLGAQLNILCNYISGSNNYISLFGRMVQFLRKKKIHSFIRQRLIRFSKSIGFFFFPFFNIFRIGQCQFSQMHLIVERRMERQEDSMLSRILFAVDLYIENEERENQGSQ